VSVSGQSYWIWQCPSGRGLQRATNPSQKISACWYSPDGVGNGYFTIDVNLTDGLTHQVAVYCMDWEGTRNQKIEIYNTSGTLLDSRAVTSFSAGKYWVWNMRGHYLIRIVNNGGMNAVMGGLFFGPSSGGGNQAPTPNAGPDQSITLPNAANLSGSATDDGLPVGSSISYTWSKASGPGTVTFGNPNAAQTTASFSSAGTYYMRLTASDSQLSGADDIIVTVNPNNQPPTISDIPNQTTISGVVLGPIGFTIGDLDTPVANLTLWAGSSNPSLVPVANIVFGGSGANRTVTVTPAAGQTGTATLTVTVFDGTTPVNDSFTLAVTAPPSSYVQIPISGMTATASSTGWDWFPAYAINGSTADPGWHNAGPDQPIDWLRINLGHAYRVGKVEYCPRRWAGNGTFTQYQIYVTDSNSSNPSDWGAPVASGNWTWSGVQETRPVVFPAKQGQYVIFRCLSGLNSYASCNEVWIYEEPWVDSDNDGLPDYPNLRVRITQPQSGSLVP
jgi:hypothetical protein